MASITERIRMNRLFADDWSVYEKLLLASAVQKSGDQNWGSVSKMILNYFKLDDKFIEIKRPNDWFLPKACAVQYQLLLETYANDLPKRKKRDKNSMEVSESPVEFIVKQLWKLRNETVQKEKDRVFKENEELTNLIRDSMLCKLPHADLIKHTERLKNILINIEKQSIIEYEEVIRTREERKKSIEKAPTYVSNVNTSLYKSTIDNDDKLSSPTSPLLTSLLQSPSRSSTPTMSNLLTNPTLSKLLETPSSLLQKELSKQQTPIQELQQQQSTQQIHPQVVPVPTPSPNSLAILEEIKSFVPEDASGDIDKNNDNNDLPEDFAEKWFDPNFLTMGKEELEVTLDAKALLEVLGGTEEVGFHARNDSVEEDSVEEECTSTLDSNEPIVEEVVLEQQIIEPVEKSPVIEKQSEPQQYILPEPVKTEIVEKTTPINTEIKEEPEIQNNIKASMEQEVLILEEKTTPPEIVAESKKSSSTEHAITENIVIERIKVRDEIKEPVKIIDSPKKSETILKSNKDETVSKQTSNIEVPKEVSKEKSEKIVETVKDTNNEEISIKETRSLRASRDLSTDVSLASSPSKKEPDTVQEVAGPRERRRSRIVIEDNKSPIRDSRKVRECDIGASPVKETRSSKSFTNKEKDQDANKELRNLRSTEVSPTKEQSKDNKTVLRSRENPSPAIDTRITRSTRDIETTASPSKELRSPRNSKEFESSLKETKNITKTKDAVEETLQKTKESLSKDRKSSSSEEIVKKDMKKEEDIVLPSPEKRKLRSESECDTSKYYSPDNVDDSDEDASEQSLSRDVLQQIEQDMSISFKTPLSNSPTLGASFVGSNVERGRKRNSTPSASEREQPASSTSSSTQDSKLFKKPCLTVYQSIISSKHASVFMKPILDSQARNYSQIILQPSNLLGLKKGVESGAIKNFVQFQKHLILVFNNAMMYNQTGSPLYELAKEMRLDCEKEVQLFNETVNGGGVTVDLNDDEYIQIPQERHKRLSRSDTQSPIPRKKDKKNEVDDDEDEPLEPRRSMKRPLAPSPRTVMSKKRRTK